MSINVFISFHHKINEKHAKEIRNILKKFPEINDLTLNNCNKIENEDSLTDEQIRQKIRDDVGKEINVCIVVLGPECKNRKWIDWEVYTTVKKYEGSPPGNIVVVSAITELFQPSSNLNFSWILGDNLFDVYDGVGEKTRIWSSKKDIQEHFKYFPQRIKNSVLDNYNPELYDEKNKSTIDKRLIKHPVFPVVQYNKVKEKSEILYESIKNAIEWANFNKDKWDLGPLMKCNDESNNREVFGGVPA